MRTRRQFQPTLDQMPCRIAPSATIGLALAASLSPSMSPPVAVTNDTDMPETGFSSPTILAPTTSIPTNTIFC